MQIRSYRRNEFRRTSHPEETINYVEAKLKELNILTYAVQHNPMEHLWSVKLTAPDLRIGSNGKGPTRVEAYASAYAELVERISIGMLCGVHLAPYRALYGPLQNLLVEVEQFRYMDGYKWGHQDSLQNAVRIEDMLRDHRFTKGQFEQVKMRSDFLRHWVPGYSLVHNKEVQVPTLLVKWISATNGIATGTTIEEAIVHACCEIYERDGLIKYLRFMNTTPAKTVIPESIKDDRIQSIMSYFKSNNVEVLIKDIGFDIYPVYAILTFNHNIDDTVVGHNFIKSGSSLDSKEALLRCFTERMQGTTFEIERDSDTDKFLKMDQKYMPIMFSGICPFNLASFNNNNNPVEFKEWTIDDTKLEVDECIAIAKKMNTDLIVVNHTHPVFDMPTVRVVMPGVSDFMKWWDETKLTMDFVGNINRQEDDYEEKLRDLLKTFRKKSISGATAKNVHRRDV